ncbi:AAA family ATPase [Puia sp. P3]|uniref:AAA family ATPase n=1 Tax=Puia sp. P3 TaxID=3423952 RepID=UPI003D674782
MGKSVNSAKWNVVYTRLARQLHKFYQRYADESGSRLFELLNSAPAFRKYNLWLENSRELRVRSVDPIQLFLSFSRSRQKNDIRTEIINIIASLLDLRNKSWKNISFEGCPAVMPLKVQRIRNVSEQMQIWKSFDEVMKIGKSAITPDLWRNAKSWEGIQIPVFTMFLFWVDSRTFLPLDKNTRLYLERAGYVPVNTGLTFELYNSLLNNAELDNYVQLAWESYYFSYDFNAFKQKFPSSYLSRNSDNRIIDIEFRLVGLRTLGRNKEAHKILKSYTYYPLDRVVIPQQLNTSTKRPLESFLFNPAEAESLYNLRELKVNISAIVGKNGSGKSTLLDLMLMGVYNLSIQFGYLDASEYKPIGKLNFEVYWHADTLYKVTFGKKSLIYRFGRVEKGGHLTYQLEKDPVAISDLFKVFFYSILVNYSHYALNSNDYKIDWVTPLSHKNDGYVTPVVINPKRTEGEIAVNNQRDLLNIRLLLNLLELHNPDMPEESFRYIDNGKVLKYFSVAYGKSNNGKKREEAERRTYKNAKIIRLIMDQVYGVFGVNSVVERDDTDLEYYIVYKMLAIIERYDRYIKEYKSEIIELISEVNRYSKTGSSGGRPELELAKKVYKLLQEIKDDPSHVTVKFKQAVNYLKFPQLKRFLIRSVKMREPIELDRYAKLINGIILSNPKAQIDLAQLLPPPIFKLDFYLDDDDKSSFSKASSGEYQMVSVLSTIVYHLRNLESVDEQYRYNYVTVLLDETELYFHPNMQRLFVRKMLEALSKMETQLYGIHIVFSTHSPFILSDIQERKILKLKSGDIVQNENEYNTFAANIHDLLTDDFFMENGCLGAFAQKKIEYGIILLNYIKVNNDIKNLNKTYESEPAPLKTLIAEKLEKERFFYRQKLVEFEKWEQLDKIEEWISNNAQRYLDNLIGVVGEPVIKARMINMFNAAFPVNTDIDEHALVKDNILQMMRKNNINPEELL